MKKAIVGVAALGAVFALGQVIARTGHQMRRRCEQMMAQLGGRGEAVRGA